MNITQERDFKGVWIPREIWLSTKLSMLEKIILTEIDSLASENGCNIKCNPTVKGNHIFEILM